MMYYLSPFSGLSGLRLLVLFYVMLSELPLPRTQAGTAASKMVLHTCPESLLGWLERLCLFSERTQTSNVVAQDSKTEIGSPEASQELGPEL